MYPKPRRERDNSGKRWRVDYDLAYDGGGSRFSVYYSSKRVARYCAWWNVKIGSWGGTAILVDREAECSNPHCPNK